MALDQATTQLLQLVALLVIIIGMITVGFRAGTRYGTIDVYPGAAAPRRHLTIKNQPDDQLDEEDDEDLPALTRAARRIYPVALRLFIIALIATVAWWLWPQITARFSSSDVSTLMASTQPSTDAASAQPTAAEVTAGSAEESIEDWQTYSNQKYGYLFRYPKDWQKNELPTSGLDVLEKQNVLEAFEFTPTGAAPSKISIRVHLESNSLNYPAANYAALHPARGEERTPFTLHGVRAIKYKSTLIQTRQTRWTTFAATADNGPMLVIEFMAPINTDDFDPLYIRAERILAAIEPAHLIQTKSDTSASGSTR